MEYMRTLLRDNELFRTFVTVSLERRSLSLSLSLLFLRSLITRLCPSVCLSVHKVGGGTQAVQPAQTG